jgi:hypothetical protein
MKVSNIVLIVAIIASVIGLATSSWSTMKHPVGSVSMGLWKSCATANGKTHCATPEGMPSAVHLVRGLAIASIVCMVAAVVIKQYYPKWMNVACWMVVAGTLAGAGAATVWATNDELTPKAASYGYSWYSNAAGAGLAAAAAGMCFFGKHA